MSVSLTVGQQPFPLLNGNAGVSLPQVVMTGSHLLQSLLEMAKLLGSISKELLLGQSCGRCPCAGYQGASAASQVWACHQNQWASPGTSSFATVLWVQDRRSPHSRGPMAVAEPRGGSCSAPARPHGLFLTHHCLSAMGMLLQRTSTRAQRARSSQSQNKPLNHHCSPTQSSLTSLDITQHM